MPDDRLLVGWREWVGLPDLGIAHLKAKVDTGARTSALHAHDLELVDRDGRTWARFEVHPHQYDDGDAVAVELPLIDHREVRPSSGEPEERPVVTTTLVLAGRPVDVEVTLARRDAMGFRMLVGREALRQGFLVDPSASYLGGRPPRSVRRPR